MSTSMFTAFSREWSFRIEGPQMHTTNLLTKQSYSTNLQNNNDILGFTCSDNGTYLCFVYKQTIDICVHTFDSKIGPKCRTIYSIPYDSNFMQVFPHKASRFGAGFIVCCKQKILTLYAPIGPLKPVIDTYQNVDDFRMPVNPVRFSLGPVYNSTLYILSEFGDIYKLPSLLTSEIELQPTTAKLMKSQNLLGMYTQVSKTWDDSKGELLVFKRLNNNPVAIKSLGESLRIIPFPDYLESEIEFLDMVSVNTNWNTDILAVLSKQFCYFAASSGPLEDDLTVLKILNCDFSGYIFTGSTQTHVLLSTESAGAYTPSVVDIDIGKWSVNPESSEFDCTLQKHEGFKLKKSPNGFIGINGDQKIVWEQEDGVIHQLRSLELTSESADYGSVKFERSTSELQTGLSSILDLSELKPQTSLRPNYESLSELNRISLKFLEKFLALYSKIELIDQLRTSQRTQISLQFQAINDLNLKLQSLNNCDKNYASKFTEIYGKFNEFNTRIENLRAAITDQELKVKPVIRSKDEERWIRELPVKISLKVDSLESELERLNLEFKNLSSFSGCDSKLSNIEVRDLLFRVREQADSINKLSALH